VCKDCKEPDFIAKNVWSAYCDTCQVHSFRLFAITTLSPFIHTHESPFIHTHESHAFVRSPFNSPTFNQLHPFSPAHLLPHPCAPTPPQAVDVARRAAKLSKRAKDRQNSAIHSLM
jgi:hypothetical protein